MALALEHAIEVADEHIHWISAFICLSKTQLDKIQQWRIYIVKLLITFRASTPVENPGSATGVLC